MRAPNEGAHTGGGGRRQRSRFLLGARRRSRLAGLARRPLTAAPGRRRGVFPQPAMRLASRHHVSSCSAAAPRQIFREAQGCVFEWPTPQSFQQASFRASRRCADTTYSTRLLTVRLIELPPWRLGDLEFLSPLSASSMKIVSGSNRATASKLSRSDATLAYAHQRFSLTIRTSLPTQASIPARLPIRW